MPHVLTEAQIKELHKLKDVITEEQRKDLVHVRFMAERRAWNVFTGEASEIGSNVIYHTTFWNVPRIIAKFVGKATNTRPDMERVS